jgi:uncharacterized FlaG/YvyC family protein
MSVGFPAVGGASRICPAPPPESEPPTNRGSFARDLAAAEAEPPAEVREEVRAAARAASMLHEMGRQLRFEPDPDGGRVRVAVCDLDGNVLRRIPLSESLEIARHGRVD